MSIISNFPAMPNRIAIAAEYLFGLGEKGDTWENVESQLSPLTQSQDEDGPEEKSGKSMAEDVLLEMERLRLVEATTPGSIALAAFLRDAAPRNGDWHAVLRPHLFSVLTDPERANELKQEDVPDALAWLLVQDPANPLGWKGGGHVNRITEQLEEGDNLRKAIGGDARFQNLVYWARYLGLAERIAFRSSSATTNEAVIPDPTEAIATRLPAVFRTDREIPIGTFYQRLATEIGVVDGGAARRGLETRLNGDFQPLEKRLSRSLSFALARLRVRKVIRLEKLSDADAFLLDLGKSSESVSHITYIAKEAV